jgi:hypothetical protein
MRHAGMTNTPCEYVKRDFGIGSIFAALYAAQEIASKSSSVPTLHTVPQQPSNARRALVEVRYDRGFVVSKQLLQTTRPWLRDGGADSREGEEPASQLVGPNEPTEPGAHLGEINTLCSDDDRRFRSEHDCHVVQLVEDLLAREGKAERSRCKEASLHRKAESAGKSLDFDDWDLWVRL